MSTSGYGYHAFAGLPGFGQNDPDQQPYYYRMQYRLSVTGPIGKPIPCGPRPSNAPEDQLQLFSLGPWAPMRPADTIAARFEEVTTKLNAPDAGLLRPFPARPASELTLEQAKRMENTWPALGTILHETGPQPRLRWFAKRFDHWLRYGVFPGTVGTRHTTLLPVADIKARWKAGLAGQLPDVSDDPEFLGALDDLYELAHIVEQVRAPRGAVLRTIEHVGPPLTGQHPVLTLEQKRALAWVWTSESSMLCPAGWQPASHTLYREHPAVAQRAQELLASIAHVSAKYHNERANLKLPPPTSEIPPERPAVRPAVAAAMLGALGLGVAWWLSQRRGGGGRKQSAPRGLSPNQVTRTIPHPRRGWREARWERLKKR